MTPSLGWINLLEGLIELRETFSLLNHRFIIKSIQLRHSQMEEMHRARHGERLRSFQASPADHSLSETEQGPVGLQGTEASFCPPFLIGQTPTSMTFPEFQRADLNSC